MLIKTVPGKCELALHALTDSVNTGQSNFKGGKIKQSNILSLIVLARKLLLI